MESIKSQHNDEIELLQSILFDTIKIIQTEPFHKLEIQIKADITETPAYTCILEIELQESYPNTQIFIFSTTEKHNKISSSRFKEVHTKIHEFFHENVGSPIIYQAVELIKEFLNKNEEKNMENEIKLVQELKVAEDKLALGLNNNLLETKKFTPVNKANYEVWFKKYIRDLEKENEAESKRKKELMSRCTGRQYFMDLKGKDKKLDDEVQEEGEEDVDFELFKQSNKVETKKDNINKKKVKDEISDGDLQHEDQDEEDFDADVFDEDLNIDDIDFDN